MPTSQRRLSRTAALRAPLLRTLLAAVLLTAIGAGCIEVFTPPPRETQNLYYSTLDEMRASADRIILATVITSTAEEIINPDTGEFLENVIYYEVTISEVYKGSSEAGDILNIILPAELTFTLDGAARRLRSGDTYLFFLNGRARAVQYPVAYGGTLWRLNGEPALAQVTSERAQFWQRSDFADEPPPAMRLTELLLDDLRQ